MGAGFSEHLQQGERVVWAAQAVEPMLLRRLGIPPRSTLQLVLHGLALTLGAAGLAIGVGGPGLSPWARAALIGGALLPPALLATVALLPRRRGYAFTDAGRGFLREGGRLIAFPLTATPEVRYDGNREAGDLTFGVLQVEVLEGPVADRVHPEEDVCLRDVPYPHAALEVLAQLSPRAPGAG